MIIDGKKVAQELQDKLKHKIEEIKKRAPGIAFLLVGDNPSSKLYVTMKKKACLHIGMYSVVEELENNISEQYLIEKIKKLNSNEKIDGILVQLPLPKHINAETVMNAIDPSKDVDGFHPQNMGKLLLGDFSGLLPCTPLGIHTLLQKYKIPTCGKHLVIVGRSNIVGKSLAAMMVQKKEGCNATVTIAHSHTKELSAITKQADILVAAIGKPNFIKKDMVKKGAVVIDVGTNYIKDSHGNKKLVGDVDFDNVAPIASYITPVPKGVGPMTITMLLYNTYKSYKMRNKLS